MNTFQTFIGIDVSRDYLDVAMDGRHDVTRVTNDQQGIDDLLDQLVGCEAVLVVMEATGGLERPALIALSQAGHAAVAVNPRQVRHYARALGHLAKTDRIDAHILAAFSRAVQPEIRDIPDETACRLSALSTRREQVVTMLRMEKNHRTQADPALLVSINRHIGELEQMCTAIEAEMDSIIRENPTWQRIVKLLKGVPGVGPVTARILVAEMPELGHMDRKEIAALAGLAPFACDSGKYRGSRHIWGGRERIRTKLYMACLSACTHNPLMRDFYQRLLAAGKKNKVARIACARKLLTILNAMVRDGQPWRLEQQKA